MALDGGKLVRDLVLRFEGHEQAVAAGVHFGEELAADQTPRLEQGHDGLLLGFAQPTGDVVQMVLQIPAKLYVKQNEIC